MGREYGHRSEVTASYGVSTLIYDTRFQFDANGVELPGRPLELSEYKIDLGWQHYWDEERHWRSSSKFGFDYEQDNGSGYFSYYKYELLEQLRYQAHGWEIRGKVGMSYYDFPVQTVSEVDPSKFKKAIAGFNLRLERRLASFLKIFAEYEHERSFSNEPFNRYRVNTVSGGLDWQY